MSVTVIITFCLIVLARITDVSLDTVRTVSVVQGRRVFAAVLGFFQAIIFISAVAKVLMNTDQPVYALAYGVGFALGTYLGIVIEQQLAFGNQLVFLLTPKGPDLSKILRTRDYRLAEIKAHTRDGDLTILGVEIPRRETQKLIRLATAVDECCSVIVNDVRLAGVAGLSASNINHTQNPSERGSAKTAAGAVGRKAT